MIAQWLCEILSSQALEMESWLDDILLSTIFSNDADRAADILSTTSSIMGVKYSVRLVHYFRFLNGVHNVVSLDVFLVSMMSSAFVAFFDIMTREYTK